jgi:hypothetical protein
MVCIALGAVVSRIRILGNEIARRNRRNAQAPLGAALRRRGFRYDRALTGKSQLIRPAKQIPATV